MADGDATFNGFTVPYFPDIICGKFLDLANFSANILKILNPKNISTPF